jgi:hypothetical protein
MAYFLVQYEGKVYANDDLYIDAIAKGERALIKMLANKVVQKAQLMDQTLYHLTDEQLEVCRKYDPTIQDFDDAFKHINVVSKETIRQIQGKTSLSFPGAAVITVDPAIVLELYKYRRVTFYRVQDYKPGAYRMVLKMAAVKICGRLYAALNAVNVRVEEPIIVTLAAK